MSSTSIGRGPAHGGNENHEANPLHTTLGEEVQQEAPAGNEVPTEATDAPPDAQRSITQPPGAGGKPRDRG